MQVRRWRAAPPTDRARLIMLTLLLAGFLSMHGFLAFSTSAQAHASAPAMASAHVAGDDAPVGADGEPTTSGADEHTPLDLHDALSGCIVALVGVALLAVCVPSWVRRRFRFLCKVDQGAVRPHQVTAGGPVRGAPPRIALCVIRV